MDNYKVKNVVIDRYGENREVYYYQAKTDSEAIRIARDKTGGGGQFMKIGTCLWTRKHTQDGESINTVIVKNKQKNATIPAVRCV